MDQITGFSTSLGTYHNMPWNKRAHTGNLGELVKKKAQPKSSESNDDEAEILSSTSLMEQSQPPYNWETGGIKNTCDDRVTVETEIESILSLLSDDEDVPTSDAASLNAFLKKAVSNMKELSRGEEMLLLGGSKETMQ